MLLSERQPRRLEPRLGLIQRRRVAELRAGDRHSNVPEPFGWRALAGKPDAADALAVFADGANDTLGFYD